MNPLRRLAFLLWFALHDLAGERRARRHSFVYAGTVLALVAFCFLVVGLARGSVLLQEQRLEKDRRSTYLRLAPQTGRSLRPEDVEKVRAAFDRLGGATGRDRVSPYRTLEWDWHDLQTVDVRLRFRGRTLAPGDPLLDSEPMDWRAPPGPDGPGVYLTRKMLEELHGSGTPPGELRVTLLVRPEPVRVLGVLSRPLPGDLQFVLSEASVEDLVRRNANPQSMGLLSGPLPRDWKDWEELPEEARKLLPPLGVEWVGPQRRGDGWVWVFQARKPYPRQAQWRRLLESLRAILAEDSAIAPRFLEFEPVNVIEAPVEQTERVYDRVGVHLRRLSDLEGLMAIAHEHGLEANGDVVEQLRALERAGAKADLILIVLVAVLMVLALCNLSVLNELRAQHKLKEIGMLKAMGMSSGLLRDIFLTEAFLVWVIGGGVGVGMGWLVGVGLVRYWVADQPGEAAVAFSCPWWWLVGILAGSAAASLASTFLATRQARKDSAMRSLAGG